MPYQIVEHIFVHIKSTNGKVDIGIHLHPEIGTPAKSLQMQTQNLKETMLG